VIGRAEIEEAADRVAGWVRITPVMAMENRAWDLDAHLTLKLESLQHSGSFKARGAFNRILSGDVPRTGVIAASGGNHGAAVAYAARRLGYRAEIFVPKSCPPVKIERLRGYDAHVTVIGAVYADAAAASELRAAETGALVVHPYDQPEVVAGQGTLGRELARQVPELDTVLVAVGGGGLIGGVAAWFGGAVRIVGVEPERAPTLARAMEAGAPMRVEVSGVAVDSLGAGRVGWLPFAIAQHYVERVVLVADEAIRVAQQVLWRDLRVVAEPGGATALAALLAHGYRPRAGERIGVIVCGGNANIRAFT